MSCCVLSIGTELTRGEVVDSNAAWLSAELTAIGFEVVEHCAVDDHPARIEGAFRRLSETARVVIATGGLGPTSDDITTAAVAQVLGVPLVRDAASIEHMRRRFERLKRPMVNLNFKQADFPEGADILPNAVGTAPGFGVRLGDCIAYFLPGVPHEMMTMFESHVVPRVRHLATNNRFQRRLHVVGLGESLVAEKLTGIEAAFPGTTIGYRVHFPETEVKVLAEGTSHATARALCERAVSEVRARLVANVYGEDDDTFGGTVGRALRTRGWTLAIAESCTGGLVGHMLTREAGASDFLLLDAVTYANSAKSRILGVDESTIRWHGAVSSEVSAAMVQGARRVSGADVGLSLTGIAGPSGATDTKPVGTVYLAVATPNGPLEIRHRVFSGDRAQIQTLAAYAGLEAVLEACARLGSTASIAAGDEHRPH
ncbi:MAG: competence/damage-inducible protein A [Polyangiaceae bacterium]|jgi:nicotinamide-nucleotide amidase